MRYLILSLAMILAASCKVDYSDQEAEAATRLTRNFVEIEKVEIRNEPVPINAIGRVDSGQEVKLSFKIGGIISSMTVDEGDYVKAGKTLASLRTNEIDAQVLKAERGLQKAERDLERIKKMYADSAATLENVQDLTTLVQVSKADLDIATFNQTYARIVSPVNGRVISRLAEPNELVKPGQSLFKIAAASGQTHVMKVALSDRDINRIDYKSKAEVFFDAFPNESFNASVINIAENSDPFTGTFEVELAIKSKGKRLRNGFIGRTEINPNEDKPYLKLPMSAIVEGDNNELSVFIPAQSDTIAQMIKVRPFHITSNSVFVLKSEEERIDRVITDGAPYLVDGDRIYPLN